MNRLTVARRLSSVALTCIVLGQTAPAFAQIDANSSQQPAAAVRTLETTESMTLTVGDILEILPSTAIQSPTYSWILTQDRTFIQAGRTETFRYRFLQPGTYTLIAEIQSADQSKRVNRTFAINAKARDRGTAGSSASTMPVDTGSGTLSGLVMIDPAMDANKRVILSPNRQLVKLTPLSPDIKPLSLDADTSKDSDGDGNPSNDVDNKSTFFQLYAEPLYVWLADPVTKRTMSVTTVGSDGMAVVQTIDLADASYAQQQGLIVSPIHFTAQESDNGTYIFTPTFEGDAPASPLLYHWSFGDGQESLLVNPTHTYGVNGAYTITLQVRNLIDGQSVAEEIQQIAVQNIITPSASSTSTADTQSSSVASQVTTDTTGRFSLSTILLLGGVFILFVILGLGITILLSKFRRGRSLDQTFADMEKAVVKSDGTGSTPPPLVIPAATPSASKPSAPPPAVKEVISKREENAASSAPVAATPRIDEKAAPSWLKKGLDTPMTQKPTVPVTPVEKPDTPMPQTPIPSAPQAKPSTSAASTPTAPTPSWLQTPTTQTTTPKPVAPSPSVPKPAAPTPSTPKPATTPASQAPGSPAPASVPPWLQKAATASPAQQPSTPPAKPASPTPAVQPASVPSPSTVMPAPKSVTDTGPSNPTPTTINAPVKPPVVPQKANTQPTQAPAPAQQKPAMPVPPSTSTVSPAPAKPSTVTTPSTPAPAPAKPVPSAAPVSQPKPATPASTPAESKGPTPSWLQTPPTQPKPAVTPTTPKPDALASPPVVPKPASTASQQSPATSTPPVTMQKPPMASTTPPAPKPQKDMDAPIAFIRAESLEKPSSPLPESNEQKGDEHTQNG